MLHTLHYSLYQGGGGEGGDLVKGQTFSDFFATFLKFCLVMLRFITIMYKTFNVMSYIHYITVCIRGVFAVFPAPFQHSACIVHLPSPPICSLDCPTLQLSGGNSNFSRVLLFSSVYFGCVSAHLIGRSNIWAGSKISSFVWVREIIKGVTENPLKVSVEDGKIPITWKLVKLSLLSWYFNLQPVLGMTT